MIGKIGAGGPKQNMLMKCVLFSSAIIGMFCDSVDLGSRLWLRGSCVFAFLAAAAWLWSLAEGPAFRLVRGSWLPSFQLCARWNARVRSALSAVAVVAALFGAMQIVRPFHLDRPRGFVDHDKYDTLTWLDRHAPPGSVIASTSIEDSFLIDFYTSGRPYVPLFGLTILPQAEIVRRYFRTIGEIEEGQQLFARLSAMTSDALSSYNVALKNGLEHPFDQTAYQAFAFYLMLLYYPFTTESQSIFSANVPTTVFLDWLRGLRDQSHRDCARYDYLIIGATEHLSESTRYDVLYRNVNYALLHPKNSSDGNGAIECR